MATITVTSTADSGSGSFRQAIADAASGDTIVFDDALEDTDGVITIELSSRLTLPAITLTIDGGSHSGSGATLQTRVVLSGQTTSGILTDTSGANATLNNITFKDADGVNRGGGAYLNSASTTVLNYCVFDNCKASYDGGAFVVDSSAFLTLNDCFINNCRGTASASYGGGGYTISTNLTTLNNCIINNCKAGVGNGFYTGRTAPTVINNCTFSNNPSNRNLYIVSTGQTTLTGNNDIDAALFGGTNIGTNIYISGSVTISGLFIGVGNTITFDGVDRILAITSSTGSTINAATFQTTTDSTGYLAFPVGKTPPTVGTGVSVATYSATAATVSATVFEREATITTNADVATSVVEAIFDDSTLSPLSVTAGKAAISKDRAFKVRLFNGSFYESSWVPRTYYYKGGTTGSFATASDWAMDSAKTLTCNASPTIANSTFDCR